MNGSVLGSAAYALMLATLELLQESAALTEEEVKTIFQKAMEMIEKQSRQLKSVELKETLEMLQNVAEEAFVKSN